MTKCCSECKETLDLACFSIRSTSKDGLQGRCKKCVAKYFRRHYKSHRQYYLDKTKRRRPVYRAQVVAYVMAVKAVNPCKDCGNQYPYYVMDFDHVSGVKVGNVAQMKSSATLSKVKREIAKCDLVCANCHRARTYNRKQVVA